MPPESLAAQPRAPRRISSSCCRQSFSAMLPRRIPHARRARAHGGGDGIPRRRRRCGPGADLPASSSAAADFGGVTGVLRDWAPRALLPLRRVRSGDREAGRGVWVDSGRRRRSRSSRRPASGRRCVASSAATAGRPRSRPGRRFRGSAASCGPCRMSGWPAMPRPREGLLARLFRPTHYVGRFPAAVVERDGRIQAFATVWPGRAIATSSRWT